MTRPVLLLGLAGLILLAFALAGCEQTPPISKAPTGRGQGEAWLIAEVDGCRIWQLSGPVYFARCPEGASSMVWEQKEGKSTRTRHTVAGR